MTNPTDSVLVFVNERPVRIPPGGTAVDAVRAHDAALADRLAAGHAYLTDGRGIRLVADVPVTAGDIIRVVVSARRAESDADA